MFSKTAIVLLCIVILPSVIIAFKPTDSCFVGIKTRNRRLSCNQLYNVTNNPVIGCVTIWESGSTNLTCLLRRMNRTCANNSESFKFDCCYKNLCNDPRSASSDFKISLNNFFVYLILCFILI